MTETANALRTELESNGMFGRPYASNKPWRQMSSDRWAVLHTLLGRVPTLLPGCSCLLTRWLASDGSTIIDSTLPANMPMNAATNTIPTAPAQSAAMLGAAKPAVNGRSVGNRQAAEAKQLRVSAGVVVGGAQTRSSGRLCPVSKLLGIRSLMGCATTLQSTDCATTLLCRARLQGAHLQAAAGQHTVPTPCPLPTETSGWCRPC